ncbi:unnamed protein product [Protopolystoma xenopodis]|uniref:Uncharacterized protein n=1 Tax=Protopolystoma xenopodis TaxID=117903 RepID=A0A448WMH4_9PLAT|nr:unnamed protein product [Protopolystoma xenopodis]
MLLQGSGLIRNLLSSVPIQVRSYSVGSFPYPLVAISSVLLNALFYTDQAFDSTYRPAVLAKPVKSRFAFGMAT